MTIFEEQLQELKAELARLSPGARAELISVPNGTFVVKIDSYKLPEGWSKQTTTIQFVLPVGYPVARPDTFFADADLRLENGGMPANTGTNHMDGVPDGLLWFSWHPSNWNPNRDGLTTFLKIIRKRFGEVR